MSNFLEDIQRTIRGDCDCEPIESVVIANRMGYYNDEDSRTVPKEFIGKPVCFGDVRDYFDYEYDTGYGGADCNAIYLYTRNFIVFVSEYDGATSVDCIPRNPTECTPNYL